MNKLEFLIIFIIFIIFIYQTKNNKSDEVKTNENKTENFNDKNKKEGKWTFIDTGGNSNVEYHYKNCKRLYNKRSKYQKIQVYKHPEVGNFLCIDKDIQLTEHDESNYHEMMVHVPLNYLPKATNVLIIGGGDGGTLTQVLKHKNLKTIINVDIDEMVIKVAKKYFPKIGKSFDNKRVKVIIDDGAKLVKTMAEDPKYKNYFDVIIRDNTDYGQSETLFKKEFYMNCSKIMKEYSILVFNYHSLGWERRHIYMNSSKTLKEDMSDFFKYTAIIQLYQPTFHSGHYSHAFVSNKIDPINSPIDWHSWYNKRIKTKYYNKSVHLGSFGLPNRLQEKKPKKVERLGSHLLVDIIQADFSVLNDKDILNTFFDACLERYNLIELKRVSHTFTPYGLTMMSLLANSHMSIHTWPEKGTACLDIFTCTDFKFENNSTYDIKILIKRFFYTDNVRIQYVDRDF